MTKILNQLTRALKLQLHINFSVFELLHQNPLFRSPLSPIESLLNTSAVNSVRGTRLTTKNTNTMVFVSSQAACMFEAGSSWNLA